MTEFGWTRPTKAPHPAETRHSYRRAHQAGRPEPEPLLPPFAPTCNLKRLDGPRLRGHVRHRAVHHALDYVERVSRLVKLEDVLTASKLKRKAPLDGGYRGERRQLLVKRASDAREDDAAVGHGKRAGRGNCDVLSNGVQMDIPPKLVGKPVPDEPRAARDAPRLPDDLVPDCIVGGRAAEMATLAGGEKRVRRHDGERVHGKEAPLPAGD